MPDFTYVDLIYLIPKIQYVFKAYMNSSISNENIENKVSKIGQYITVLILYLILSKYQFKSLGYICNYFEGSLSEYKDILSIWPSNDEISVAIYEAYKEANNLAKTVGMFMDLDFLLSTTFYNVNEKLMKLKLKIIKNLSKGKKKLWLKLLN